MSSCILYTYKEMSNLGQGLLNIGCDLMYNINHNFKQSLVFYCQFWSKRSLYLLYSRIVTITNGRRFNKQIVYGHALTFYYTKSENEVPVKLFLHV